MQHDSAMHSNDGFKVFLNKVIRRNRKEVKQRGSEISAPFNFQKCNLDLAGISAGAGGPGDTPRWTPLVLKIVNASTRVSSLVTS